MSSNWYDYVMDHLEELTHSETREAKALLALFSLDGEFNNGGLIQYLMNESGDTWKQLKDAFELGNCSRGVEWMQSVERLLDRPMPQDRDARLEVISTMPTFRKGEDPFEEPDAVLAQGLIDDIQEVGETLVRSIQG